MSYEPKLYHFAVPVGIMSIGGAMFRNWGFGADVWALATPFYFGGFAATVWMIGQGWLGYMAEIEMTKAANPPVQQREEPHPTSAQELPIKVNGYQQVVTVPQQIQKDQRWQQWARAVLYDKTSMSQSKWTGRGKPFSKTEYSPRLNSWLADGYIATVNPRDANQGYKINGSRGRDYFQGLATGQTYIPLPHSE